MSNDKPKTDVRADKRAAALRENLRKRKALQAAKKAHDSKENNDSNTAS